MTLTALIFFYAILGFVVIQGFLVSLYNKALKKTTVPGNPRQAEVAVILCVRGEDPSLESCLRSLANQAYANKKIFVV
ncbi:MAG: glycosyltransferase family 2 protein, partial [Planctomycetota bacterium]|nr:glycosyltransferase family 2 protein [Planctomycetota bacterium]